jgi:hypothetical protein
MLKRSPIPVRRALRHTLSHAVLATLLAAALMPAARADDADALALGGAPEPAARVSDQQPLRLYAEAAVGRIQQRYGQPGLNARRTSLDLTWSTRLNERWRVALSDRLDDIHPVDAGARATQNSLREAYASWQDEGGQRVVEFGRINLRNGPAYGYNPTDYFRDGALRAVTTADPFALRENRLGTVMLRAQQLWAGGGVSLALAPKLADQPGTAPMSLDLGATNATDKALASWSVTLSDRVSAQLLGFAQRGKGMQWGASMTALVSDAAVAQAEWSHGRDDDLFSATTAGTSRRVSRDRLSAGLTYTTANRLALTAEYEFNGFAPGQAAWQDAGQRGPQALGAYLLAAQTRQDNAGRQAWLFYASQKSAGLKNLDLTGLLRLNADDHSHLGWLEARYHFGSADVALQWQWTQGKAISEYGLVPYRQTVQLLGAWYF